MIPCRHSTSIAFTHSKQIVYYSWALFIMYSNTGIESILLELSLKMAKGKAEAQINKLSVCITCI